MFWQNTDVSFGIRECPEDGVPVSIAGRVVSFRRQGGIAFGHLYDGHGTVQFAFQKKVIGDLIKDWSSQIKVGCHIGISGETWTTSTKEHSILVKEFKLLQDVWRPFPTEWFGIADEETKLRKRYLDCILNPETNQIFRKRSEMINRIRNFLVEEDFLEFETPVLSPQASGAAAAPFITHHNALDADLFLRIAPETYLKRAVGAGYGRVFEIGKQFRNEGVDPSHLQEFTSLEWYAAYHDYMDNLSLFEKMLSRGILLQGFNMKMSYQGITLDFENCPRVKYRDIFQEKASANPDGLDYKAADALFKEKVRPSIIQPTYVLDYPAHMSPMAARKKDDPKTVEQWQLIANGWELVKCYTELTDPILQRQLLNEQMQAKEKGDQEAMELEEGFLEAMEYGLPPMSGLGLGIDRLVCLLTNQTSLKNVVMFPTMLKR